MNLNIDHNRAKMPNSRVASWPNQTWSISIISSFQHSMPSTISTVFSVPLVPLKDGFTFPGSPMGIRWALLPCPLFIIRSCGEKPPALISSCDHSRHIAGGALTILVNIKHTTTQISDVQLQKHPMPSCQ